MDNGEEEGQHRNDYKRRHGFHAEEGHEMISQPDGSPRFQKSRAKADAYAEKGDSAPVDMRDCLFPGHKAHFWKHHEHNTGNGDGGSIKGMKFLLRYPEEKEQHRNQKQFLFIPGNRPQILQHFFQCFPAAGHFLHFRRHDMDEKEIKHHRHNGCIGSSGDKPFQPADILAQYLLDKSDGHHVLGSCGLDTDIPEGIGLSHRHHEHSSKGGALLQPKGPDNAYHDRHHAGYTGRSRGNEEGKQESHENDANHQMAGFHADMGHDHQGDTLIQTRNHHACRQEHGTCHQSPG